MLLFQSFSAENALLIIRAIGHYATICYESTVYQTHMQYVAGYLWKKCESNVSF